MFARRQRVGLLAVHAGVHCRPELHPGVDQHHFRGDAARALPHAPTARLLCRRPRPRALGADRPACVAGVLPGLEGLRGPCRRVVDGCGLLPHRHGHFQRLLLQLAHVCPRVPRPQGPQHLAACIVLRAQCVSASVAAHVGRLCGPGHGPAAHPAGVPLAHGPLRRRVCGELGE